MLSDRVARFHAAFDAGRAMDTVAQLVRHDRYQSSAGIAAAAAYVAEQAERAGLADVEVLRFAAGQSPAWWTFDAPPGWTPRAARLDLLDERHRPIARVVEYPAQPYALAAYSAPATETAAPLVRWTDDPWPPGGVLLGTGTIPWTRLLDAARRRGMAGIVTADGPEGRAGRDASKDRADPAGRDVPGGPEGRDVPDGSDGALRRRVELPPGCGMFAFSVTVGQMERLLAHHRDGGAVAVTVDAAGEGDIPVVVGRVPGDDEIVCTAHLCHPAPGANDNASGVAVALETARLLTGEPGTRGVRFVWGPEFLGVAAYLRAVVDEGRAPRPLAAVNLDMVGQDQRRCGGPLIVERSPDHVPSFLNALTEESVRLIPQRARSYSGAMPCDTWAWRATPFVGASDHALFADRSVGCPAVQFGHWPDRFNHTSGDGIDKVDPEEMRRVAAAATATMAAIRAATSGDADGLADLVARWGAASLFDRLPHPDDPRRGRDGWIDPDAMEHRAARLDHDHRVAAASLRSLDRLGMPPARDRLDWLDRLAGHVRQSLPAGTRHGPRGPVLRRRWPGPFNLRAFVRSCIDEDAAWIGAEMDADRGRCYATVLALAQAVDGRADREQVARTAAFASGLAVRRSFAERFVDAAVRAGWLEDGEHGHAH